MTETTIWHDGGADIRVLVEDDVTRPGHRLYYWSAEDWGRPQWQPISEAFYNMLLRYSEGKEGPA
jgi:hypothetical protein